MNTIQAQAARFLAEADRAYLGELNRRIRQGERHLTQAAREQLTLTGHSSRQAKTK
jgi:hypothetical protein